MEESTGLLPNQSSSGDAASQAPSVDGELTPEEERWFKTIEMTRMGLSSLAIYFGFAGHYRTFAGLFVTSMDLSLGANMLLGRSEITAKAFKWPLGPFFRQSACNFLANGTTMLLMLAVKAPDAALASILLSSSTFFIYSGINHIGTERYYAKRDNRPPTTVHYYRILGSTVMVGVNYFITFGLWKPFQK